MVAAWEPLLSRSKAEVVFAFFPERLHFFVLNFCCSMNNQQPGRGRRERRERQVQRVRPCGHVHARFVQPARFAGPAELMNLCSMCPVLPSPLAAGDAGPGNAVTGSGGFSSNTK